MASRTSSESPKHFADLVASRRVLVFLGAGGVGKTTTSIACALAAAQAGRKVALLSIDPARRLAAALGIALGNQLRRVTWPEGVTLSGSVDAAMLDQKAVFDAMVRRHAPHVQAAERILEHPIYRAISANLSGPLEYMALAKLQELAEDPSYDLIVLDTPPDSHAMDFLTRPNLLAGFMDSNIMSWLVKPFALASRFGLGRALSFGERLMGGVAKVTGMTALSKFAEFLMLIQEVIEGFHRSGQRVVQLLRDRATGFVLVSMATSAAARSALSITDELVRQDYRLDSLIFNRCLPSALLDACGQLQVASDFSALSDEQALRNRASSERATIGQLAAALNKHHGASPPVVRLAEEVVASTDDDQVDAGVRAIIALAEALARAPFNP